MKMFFIKKDKLIKLLLITLIIMNFFPWSIITLWCLGLIIYFYTLRRNRINYKEVINIQPDVMLSPVDGVVKEIIPNINDEFHNVIKMSTIWRCNYDCITIIHTFNVICY